ETDAVVRAKGERLEVGPREVLVERRCLASRRRLEERVVVVPRAQVGRLATEALRACRVERRLPRREGVRGHAVDVVARREQTILVELAGREREREVVSVAERSGRRVAEPGKLADPVGHLGPDLLRGL